MPLEELGRRGIELISSLSAEEPIGEVIITDPIELIVRGSTAPPG
jgi:DNA-binding LacI/PurR family transcriptional regulator